MERGMISFVALVFPDVNCQQLETKHELKKGNEGQGLYVISSTKCVIVSNLSAPAANQIDPVFCHTGHAGIPLAD